MSMPCHSKYQPLPRLHLPDRTWPDRTLSHPPIWCSVDLRDGNQALADPMSVAEKLDMFDLLVSLGFKEIEVGFPSASQIEFDFTRRLITENRIPPDVWIQVLVQCREDLIDRTIQSLQGAHRAIIHIYNSTSPLQRRVVFNQDKNGIRDIAIHGVSWVKSKLHHLPNTQIRLEYSPESFSATETDFALDVCLAVADIWQPSPNNPIIFNLPATVEYHTPNVHADQIEWFCRHLPQRDTVLVSLHTHNDRGTGVAATELGLLAGADRVEGTLFGNGERTGNLDIITVALNLLMHGIDPGLDLHDLPAIRRTYERCTRMTVHPRHPYGGDLVFTAFSGSHQDAINKGFKHMENKAASGGDSLWEVPYIPIDPRDIGRTYDAIIRINTQSGKGGVAYLMRTEFGYHLPKSMHREVGKLINDLADQLGREVTLPEIHQAFRTEFLDRAHPLALVRFFAQRARDSDLVSCEAELTHLGQPLTLHGTGNGPLAALVHALRDAQIAQFDIHEFSEHSLGTGAEARAVAYIEIEGSSGRRLYGAGEDTNIEIASVKALLSALNRLLTSP
ncbi:MAG: 2-isopropylmalate synthase [Verrucomicrobiia bacterium]